jgi:hypothetical protein
MLTLIFSGQKIVNKADLFLNRRFCASPYSEAASGICTPKMAVRRDLGDGPKGPGLTRFWEDVTHARSNAAIHFD